MASPKSSLASSIPKCFASCSIGSNSLHRLPEKLQAISSAGFNAIELSFPDLLSFASDELNSEVQPTDYDKLCEAAKRIKELCDSLQLKILVLQPFANFEGWPEKSNQRKDAFERARGWIRIMKAARTDMLQASCPLSFMHSSIFLMPLWQLQ